MHLPIALLACGGVLWLSYLAVALRVRRTVPVLERLAPAPLPRWPKLSIVVPARNEARHLEEAVRTRLGQDYPDLEVIVVDDRSTDGTGEILDRLAAADVRIKPIHVRALPYGWLGKLHAMDRGVAASTGEWVLLSDADVHLAPGTLRKVVAWAEAHGLDHVSALPTVWSRGLLLDVVIAWFVRALFAVSRVWRVSDPASGAAVGCGAFNLMRRSSYARSPGLEWLKLEVGDDMALAQMLKQSGSRTAFLNGRNVIGLEFYESVPHMAGNVEKVAGVAAIGPGWLAASAVALLVAELAPFVVALWPAGLPWPLRLAAIVLCVAAAAGSAIANRWMGQPVGPALLVPAGPVIACGLLLRAAALAWLRGGIFWRDTFYPLSVLRAGGRFRIGV